MGRKTSHIRRLQRCVFNSSHLKCQIRISVLSNKSLECNPSKSCDWEALPHPNKAHCWLVCRALHLAAREPLNCYLNQSPLGIEQPWLKRTALLPSSSICRSFDRCSNMRRNREGDSESMRLTCEDQWMPCRKPPFQTDCSEKWTNGQASEHTFDSS